MSKTSSPNKRLHNALTQKIYLLEERLIDKSQISYVILGSTNNCYDVAFQKTTWSYKWSCTCPDHQRRHIICKHILFCQEKVLTGQEDKWNAALNRIKLCSADYTVGKSQQRNYIREACSICLDDMNSSEVVSFCETCGKSVHSVCYNKWAQKNIL
jgi:hypothetical protein